MDEYKGIKRSQSRDVFSWLDDFCTNQNPLILENDITLQQKVKKFYFKKSLKILLLNISIWGAIIYGVIELIKDKV